MNLQHKRIIISKTNQIGDVTFALPLASAIKQAEPSAVIILLAKAYIKDIADHYLDVDEFVSWEDIEQAAPEQAVQLLQAVQADTIIHVHPNKQLARLAKQAQIPTRIATGNRPFHWLTCNKLIKVSRKKSPLHECQLDMHYLRALGLKSNYSLAEIIKLRRFDRPELTTEVASYLCHDKFNLILHPKTRGEHIEYAPANFASVIKLLPQDKFNLLITGSAQEGQKVYAQMIEPFGHVHDLCGKLSLPQLQQLIAHADGLIAASTGPVHLAACYGIHTLGLYAPIKPFDAGRWGPIGAQAQVLCIDKICSYCRDGRSCLCVNEITPEQIVSTVQSWSKDNSTRSDPGAGKGYAI